MTSPVGFGSPRLAGLASTLSPTAESEGGKVGGIGCLAGRGVRMAEAPAAGQPGTAVAAFLGALDYASSVPLRPLAERSVAVVDGAAANRILAFFEGG